jgi:hypothetical protein
MRRAGGKILLMSMLGLASAGASPAFAGFVGTTATVNYEWPNVGTVLYSGGSASVVSGGTTFSMQSGNALADIADSSVSLTFPGGWGFSTAAKTFDGVVITDPGVNITGVSLVSSNIPGYVADDLSSDSTDVFINFPFPPFSALPAGATLVVNVSFAPVPEPATLAVLSVGLLGIATGRRRRRRVLTLPAPTYPLTC